MDVKFYSFLGIVKKSGNLVEGYNNCEDALSRRKLSLLILTEDLADNSKEKFRRYAKKGNVKVLNDFDKELLGGAIGKSQMKVLGVTNKEMTKKLLELYNS